jgi:predicted component of type VI protein secretion system
MAHSAGAEEAQRVEAKLIVLGGKKPGQQIPITVPEFVVGRGEDCQLRPRSDQVSRRHCAILVGEGRVLVRDFGSRNGTYVNGEKIEGDRELKSGDRLRVGSLEFEVHLTVSVAGKKKPKVRSIKEAAARTRATPAEREDIDVTRWLEEEEEEADPRAQHHDTVSGTSFGSDTVPGLPAADDKTVDAEQMAKLLKEPTVQIVGKSQTQAKPTTESSRTAAADMLAKFFKPHKL